MVKLAKRWGLFSQLEKHTHYSQPCTPEQNCASQPEVQKCAWFLDYSVIIAVLDTLVHPHIPPQSQSLPGLQQPEF